MFLLSPAALFQGVASANHSVTLVPLVYYPVLQVALITVEGAIPYVRFVYLYKRYQQHYGRARYQSRRSGHYP